MAVYALRLGWALCRSFEIWRSNLSRKLLVRLRTAVWPAIQSVRRNRAFPYFEICFAFETFLIAWLHDPGHRTSVTGDGVGSGADHLLRPGMVMALMGPIPGMVVRG